MQKLILTFFLSILMILVIGPVNAGLNGQLQENEVRQFVQQMNVAAKKRNHHQIIGMFSPNASIKVTVDGMTQNLTRKEYYDLLGKGGASVLDSEYNASIDSIQIKQHKAMVVLTVRESVNSSIYGVLNSVAKEVAIIENVNGKLMITTLISNVSFTQSF